MFDEYPNWIANLLNSCWMSEIGVADDSRNNERLTCFKRGNVLEESDSYRNSDLRKGLILDASRCSDPNRIRVHQRNLSGAEKGFLDDD